MDYAEKNINLDHIPRTPSMCC